MMNPFFSQIVRFQSELRRRVKVHSVRNDHHYDEKEERNRRNLGSDSYFESRSGSKGCESRGWCLSLKKVWSHQINLSNSLLWDDLVCYIRKCVHFVWHEWLVSARDDQRLVVTLDYPCIPSTVTTTGKLSQQLITPNVSFNNKDIVLSSFQI